MKWKYWRDSDKIGETFPNSSKGLSMVIIISCWTYINPNWRLTSVPLFFTGASQSEVFYIVKPEYCIWLNTLMMFCFSLFLFFMYFVCHACHIYSVYLIWEQSFITWRGRKVWRRTSMLTGVHVSWDTSSRVGPVLDFGLSKGYFHEWADNLMDFVDYYGLEFSPTDYVM